MDAEKRVLPRGHLVEDPDLYHYAVVSDNVLACSVVVNSTICNSKVLAYVFILSMPNWYQSVFLPFIFSWDLGFWIKLQSYMGVGQIICWVVPMLCVHLFFNATVNIHREMLALVI